MKPVQYDDQAMTRLYAKLEGDLFDFSKGRLAFKQKPRSLAHLSATLRGPWLLRRLQIYTLTI